MLKRLYTWYGRKTVWAVTAVLLILVIAGAFITQNRTTPEDLRDEQLPLVKVVSVSDISSQDSVTLIGTVRAVNEAQIQSENAGRVTSVTVSLGQAVAAGQVLGQQENAAQRASVLQAEGSYEAALASAQQSGVSINEAENNLVSIQNSLISTNRSAYTTVNEILLNTIDDFFSNPTSPLPGLRIGAQDYRSTLNNERYALNQTMSEWKNQTNSLTPNSNLESAIDISITNTETVLTMVDIFSELINDGNRTEILDGSSVESYNTLLLNNRATLNATIAALRSAKTNLTSAQEALSKAQIGGGSQTSSAASAQIKQALGSLRAAQANLEKTVFRTPIAGTINSLNMNVGDYISAFTQVAEVANNNALEISIFVGQSDLSRIVIGDTVRIANKFDGTVTHIAPSIDSTTQKSEIKIATETSELTNGDTVSVELSTTQDTQTEQTLLLPLTAIKFSSENGTVFTVEGTVLVAHEVELGKLRGSYVEVLAGITTDMVIVLDARGLSSGGKVSVTQ